MMVEQNDQIFEKQEEQDQEEEDEDNSYSINRKTKKEGQKTRTKLAIPDLPHEKLEELSRKFEIRKESAQSSQRDNSVSHFGEMSVKI